MSHMFRAQMAAKVNDSVTLTYNVIYNALGHVKIPSMLIKIK